MWLLICRRYQEKKERKELRRETILANIRKRQELYNALIDKFADDGIMEIENREILKFQPFDTFGTPYEIVKEFGGKDKYEEAIKELKKELFNDEVA